MNENKNNYVFDNSLSVNKSNNVNFSSGYTFKLERLPPSFAVFNKMENQFPLKFPNPEKDILSIIGIPSTYECRIFSQGGKPVFISEIAAHHYGVYSLEELIGKPAVVFRRYRDEQDNYEEPHRWHTCKITIKNFSNLGFLNQATATTENDKGLIENIVIQRICIDWNYKKLN